MEHLRDAIVYPWLDVFEQFLERQIHTCKHGDLVDIVELPEIFSVETGPQVGYQNLGSLVESDSSPVEDGLVTETGEALC